MNPQKEALVFHKMSRQMAANHSYIEYTFACHV